MGSGAQGQVDLLAECFWMVQTTRLIGGLVAFMISLHHETLREDVSDDLLIPSFRDPLPTSCIYITDVVSLIPYIHNDHL